MTKKHLWLAVLLIVLSVLLVPAIMLGTQVFQSRDNASVYGLQVPHLDGVSFQWTDTSLQQHAFPASKPMFSYMFMGFLSCSEICPIRIKQLHQLEAAIATDPMLASKAIQFLFITIDPENDTPTIRKAVIDDQSPRFVSATLQEDQLLSLSNQLSENIQSHSATNNHVGNLYLIAPNGKIDRVYTAKHLSTDKMLAELKQYMDASGNK
ncbi:SCO family protein [Shewanella aestuarii]|uniref:SCO family protein n=1 Tax=Shewanella aestuarii TaxID=1028752 RepID=A0A6G9QFJ3_9GAMM|nr:SCO family protein [Shewanella aestuarii]QIR13290.1 SCO family protein [Shewanella aestuarii]